MKAYVLTIKLLEMEPPVWRRVVLPAGVTFQRLHAVLQNVTNFQSAYLDFPRNFFEFRLPEENLLITNEPSIYEKAKQKKTLTVRKPQSTKIDVFLEKYGRLDYRYDFGDNWEFEILLEEIVEDYHFGYPVLLDGEGDAPPEDAGGVHGFQYMLEVLADEAHPDYEHMLWWSKEQRFRPYDRGWINDFLREMKVKKTEWDKINHVNHRIVSDKYYVEDEKAECRAPLPEGFDPELFWSYVRACTNLYGVVPLEQVAEIFNRQNPRLYLHLGHALQVIFSPQSKEKLEESFIKLMDSNFVHGYVVAEDAKEQIQKEQVGKEWYIPEKDELLRYSEDAYIEVTPAYTTLRSVLAPHFSVLHPIGIDRAIRRFAWNIQLDTGFNRSLTGLLSDVGLSDERSMKKVAAAAINFSNHHRLWANRGHAPVEISGNYHLKPLPKQEYVIPGTEQKAGRNDPCPCGSGKKYKNCCGK